MKNGKLLIIIAISFVLGIFVGYLVHGAIINKQESSAELYVQAENNINTSTVSDNTDVNKEAASKASLEEVKDNASEENSVAEEEPEVTPIVNGMFSWHKFKEKYVPILKEYNIDQVYQCYDSQIREEDYEPIKDSLKLLSDYDVWLLTGDPSWTAEDMLKKVDIAKEIGGFAGVVFDVEPDDYDEEYLDSVKTVCEESDIPIMFCLSYRADPKIVKEVISVVDGLLVMNYDVGDEYKNIKDLIPTAEQYNVPIITVYELQPSDHNDDLRSSHTYNGDIDAALENFKEQFKGEENIGIAYHYIKYVNTSTP